LGKFLPDYRSSENISVFHSRTDLILLALGRATVLLLPQIAAEEKIDCPEIVQTGAGC
jgi:hypothetical protein